MREILFRGESGDGWHYGLLTKYGNHKWRVIEEDNNMVTVKTNTIGQYTGLIDKNGTKIFEGDIVTCEWDFLSNGSYHHYEDFIVEFKDAAYYIVPIKKHKNIWTVYLNPESEYEVIGNIYDTNI